MNSIVRKRLIALLSLAGFAGSGATTTAQVLKGSEPAKTNSESKIKANKTALENKAATSNRKDKWAKSGAAQYPIEHGKEASHTNTKTDASIKLTKNAASGNAARNDNWVKGGKTAAGKNATRNDINKKANQASPK